MTPRIQKLWTAKSARLRRDLGRREHEAHTKRLRAAGVRSAVARPELPFSLEQFRQWLLREAGTVDSTVDLGRPNPFEWTCQFCGDPFGLEELSVDHSTPLSMGGGTVLENLLCVCKRCNTDKGELGAEEFKALRALVMGWDSRVRGAFWRRWRSLATYLQRSRKGDEPKPRRPRRERQTDDWLRVVRRSRR